MLTKGDDFPLHQTSEPVAFAGTDRNFYDRYFFNGYSPDGRIFFAAAMGFLWLSTVPLTNGVLVSLFGVRHLGMLSGAVFFSHQVGSFLGVWLGGLLYDRTGSYDVVWWLTVLLGLLATAANLPVREQPVPAVAVQS